MLENSWNVSVRRTFDLPLETHRYLVEPISEQIHLKKILIKRFLSFIRQIEKSSKILPKQLLNLVRHDTRYITGSNIRKILLLTNKSSVEEITNDDIEHIEYAAISDENRWRIDLIREITDTKFGQLQIDGYSFEECEDILQFACVS